MDDALVQLAQSRQAISRSFAKVERLAVNETERVTLLSPLNRLLKNQILLEKELEKGIGTDLGFYQYVVGGLALLGVGGFTIFKISQQLTESTDYEARLSCVERGLERGLSRNEALRTCGFAGGSSLTGLFLVGGLLLGAIFIFKR